MSLLLALIAPIAFGAWASYHVGRSRQLNIDIPRMRPLCEEIDAFADGELDKRTARKVRLHLPDCARCQARLLDRMRLDFRMYELGEAIRKGRL